MIRVHQIDEKGERIEEDVEMDMKQWERLKRQKNLRWKESDEQRPSQTKQEPKPADPNEKTDGEKAVMEIGGKPSNDFSYTEALAYIERLETVGAVEHFTRKDTTRNKVTEAKNKRIELIQSNEV